MINAFYRLCSERNYNNGPLPLPESIIERYAQTNGANNYPIDLFINAISQIDSLWLEHQAKKIKEATK